MPDGGYGFLLTAIDAHVTRVRGDACSRMIQQSRAGRMPSRQAILAGAMAVVLFQGAHRGVTAQEGASRAHRPPHLQRGDEVEARYRSYQERLERFFRDLAARLEAEAPDLLAKLREAPPAPVTATGSRR